MINTLCGLIPKNAGTARVGAFNIDENLRSIRKRMGVVSQFDVLWDELTGVEHMHLFQTLKRVEMARFDEFVEERLGAVGLRDSGNLTVGKYSGGMRRRISLALSTMGNPNVILMDEPTTGMDPVSRRHAWSLIQSLKNDTAIIMSTHAMEEAELLSDKLLILDHGKIVCVGTPMQLKTAFGDGYRVSMITDMHLINQAKNLMQILIPDCVFLETSGDSGGMVFTIAMNKIDQLGPLFCIMEGSAETDKDLKISDK